MYWIFNFIFSTRCTYFYLQDGQYYDKVYRHVVESRHANNFFSESSNLKVTACVGAVEKYHIPREITMRLRITSVGEWCYYKYSNTFNGKM